LRLRQKYQALGLLARQNGVARSHFGKFDSQAEAEKWIAEHH
jgi:hypothetical protein